MPTNSGGQGGTPRRPARRASSARPGAKSAASRPSPRTGGARSSARTSGALRQAAAAARSAKDRKATRSLRRILVLASIFVLLAITLVPTLRSYLRQQGDIDAMREQVAGQRVKVEELQKEQARWNDDAYVEQQARERLKFVKVGDRSYTVIDGDPEQPETPGVAAAPTSKQDSPWYGRVWESAKVADRGAPDAGSRSPATTPGTTPGTTPDAPAPTPTKQ
jgi:cell division protein FtsB